MFRTTADRFRVEADSSDFATGAVLSQQSPSDTCAHPVAYYSKVACRGCNYEIHEKRCWQSSGPWRTGVFLEGARPQV